MSNDRARQMEVRVNWLKHESRWKKLLHVFSIYLECALQITFYL